ncbi:MAG: serine/threonine protein kinase, partial [Betaproteobacteria bacterium]
RFGRYLIVGELGRGAMGAVYRAIDPLIEREVAIKTLLPHLPEDEMVAVRERFLREARSAGRLNHPNIVTIFDVGEQDGLAYIAMELLEGRTLQQMLTESRRLPVATAADIAAQVADALDHALGFGIVHRDVKPANIMVSASGRAKLADFGVAHLPSASMTHTGAALGSPKYMAPEQVIGQPVDPRADIFSLGAVLYEMLTGRTPFEREGETTVFALMNRIVAEPHAPVSKIDPSLPPAFDRILARALAKLPADRYQRAGEMARDLRGYRDAPVRETTPAPALQQQKTASLLADLDMFSATFEVQQRERVRAEEVARRKKEDEAQRWIETQARERERFEREREQAFTGTQGGTRPSAAILLARQQAAKRAVATGPGLDVDAAAKVSARLRAAFQYLSELSTALNEAHPVSDRPYSVIYVGKIQNAILADGFTDYRSRIVAGTEVFDFVMFKYKVRCPKPATVEVVGSELPYVREKLESMRIQFAANETRNDVGNVVRATLAMSGPFPCEAILRGDYERGGVRLELENVRQLGVFKMRLALEEFSDDVLDEFGTYVLGASDSFERFLKRL